MAPTVDSLQLLAPCQRAALILRDVLGFPARDAAAILGTTGESVTSALQRARAAPERRQRRPAEREPPPAPGSAAERNLAGRLTRAFAAADVDGIVALLSDDVWVTMPPLPLECQGRDLAGAFRRAVIRPGSGGLVIATGPQRPARVRLLCSRPARPGVLHRQADRLDMSGTRVCAMTRFDGGVLPRFGLPAAPPGSAPDAWRAGENRCAPTRPGRLPWRCVS